TRCIALDRADASRRSGRDGRRRQREERGRARRPHPRVERMSEVAELGADLVRIDSVNPALIPGAAGEAEVAGFVAAWLRRAGLDVEVVEPVAGRPSVIGIA